MAHGLLCRRIVYSPRIFFNASTTFYSPLRNKFSSLAAPFTAETAFPPEYVRKLDSKRIQVRCAAGMRTWDSELRDLKKAFAKRKPTAAASKRYKEIREVWATPVASPLRP